MGLVTSACFASLGHNVRCVEPQPDRLDRIRDGELPIREPGLDDLVQETVASGLLQFTGSIDESLSGSRFAFLAVPTPQTSSGEPDTSAVMSVAERTATYGEPGTIVVIKSTVPVGTGACVESILGGSMTVASNPEFLREGSAVKDFMTTDRVVVGARDETVARSVGDLYKDLDTRFFFTDTESAELAKYASNAYLAVRLSFVNEIARISDAVGADIDQVTEILGADHRIGSHYLKTGIGWGGSCLPKDVAALTHFSREAGVEPHMLTAAQVANSAQIDFLVATLEKHLGELDGKVIAMLGAAFKAGTDDVRESPALTAAMRLASMNVEVRVHDPLALRNAAMIAPELHHETDMTILTSGADAVILSTDWPQYQALDWVQVAGSMRGRLVFDARNALNKEVVERAGLNYAAYGRRSGP